MAADTRSTPRRALMAAAGTLTVAALLPLLPSSFPLGAVPALADAEPDAALIAACDGYIAALDAFNRDDLDHEDSPHGAEADACFARFFEARPAQTLAGVLAQARVAAFLAHQPYGCDWRTALTAQWPQWALEDLLRILGSPAA